MIIRKITKKVCFNSIKRNIYFFYLCHQLLISLIQNNNINLFNLNFFLFFLFHNLSKKREREYVYWDTGSLCYLHNLLFILTEIVNDLILWRSYELLKSELTL